jgi:vancomycin aglycone glucosyltransferase
MPAEARTYGDGRSEMRVLSSAYGPRGEVEPMAGLAVRLRALGAEFDTVAVAADRCDALVASGVMPTGVWL